MKVAAAALLLVVTVVFNPSEASAGSPLDLIQISSGLNAPVAITNAGDGSDRLFFTEQEGLIKVRAPNGVISTFLNISGIVQCCGEEGLLSVAFHPSFETNGFFFVYYTNSSGNNVVARYSASPASSNTPTISGGGVLLEIIHPTYDNHNGGQLQFGPDGNLYISTGDGGSAGDPNNNAQNIGSLLGKILRITPTLGTTPGYTIPSGNPFAATGNPGRDEIWSYGLRNPFRFSFDRTTGDMWIGDVGQGAWEEVDFQEPNKPGTNFGWRLKEGAACFNPPQNCDPGGLTDPVITYANEHPSAVTGGYVYRGPDPVMKGIYFYADFYNGKIWTSSGSGNSRTVSLGLDTDLLISSFGEDDSGNLYLASYEGGVYQVGSSASLGWESLGGVLQSAPDASSWEPNRLDTFVNGSDAALWHRWWDGRGWQQWESLGGGLTSGPTSVSWGPNRIDVFVKGTDNALWHKWYSGAWSAWESLGGNLTSGPDVASWESNRLDVFARGTDSQLWHRWWDGDSWEGWAPLGGLLTSDPGAVSWGANRIDVFARGANNALWHRLWNGSAWQEWESLGGVLTSGPDAASWATGRLDVFARGDGDQLQHKWWNGSSWSGFENLGAPGTFSGAFLKSDPSAVSWGFNRIDVFGQGPDAAMWHRWWNESSWS